MTTNTGHWQLPVDLVTNQKTTLVTLVTLVINQVNGNIGTC